MIIVAAVIMIALAILAPGLAKGLLKFGFGLALLGAGMMII